MNRTHRAPKVPKPLGSGVLAERNQAAAAVGAWVESGAELREHPATVAALTEELQQQRRLRSEHHLRLFQENVRLRVAEQERRRRRERPGAAPQAASGAERSSPCGHREQDRPESGLWVRRRLARPRPPELSRHDAAGHMSEEDDDEAEWRRSLTAHKDEEQEEEAEPESVREESVCRALWPIDHSEEQRRQRQNQILTQRRLFLSKDRQQVKEKQEHKRHTLRTASLKQEKERARLEEERRLGEERLLTAARQTLELRERQVQQALRQEAAAADGDGTEAPKTDRRVSALRAQLRALFSGSGSEPPPLCCCGSFWDSHPDTCANNCAFHNNPKAYIQALQTVVHSWDLL